MNVAGARQAAVPQSPDLYRRAHNTLISEITAVIPVDAVKSIDELTCRVTPSERGDPRTLGLRIKKRIAEYGAEILFAHRPVTGAFRFKTLHMQILPPPPGVPRPPHLSADHPLFLSTQYGAIKRPTCSICAVERTQWSGRGFRMPCFVAQSNSVVPAQSYFGDARAQAGLPIDSFFLSDNLDALITAFVKLDGDRWRRFLRSAAAIYMAGTLWESSITSFFLACVQAIETLVDRAPATPCPTCSKDMGPGPTKLFREFVEKHCLSSEVDQAVVKNCMA